MNAENLLGKKIMELREVKNLTQAELAEKLGVSDKMISKWECGETNPNLNLLPAIADCFDTNIDSLFEHKHNYREDIARTVFDYMANHGDDGELDSMRNITFQALYGLTHKYAAKYNGKEVADELLEKYPAPDVLGRPSRYVNSHGYSTSIENKSLNMQVINLTPEDNYKDMFDKYEDYRHIFEILAIPDAGKILKYLYIDNSPQDCTLEYISEQSGADIETVEKIVNLLESSLSEATINGEKTNIYSISLPDELFTVLCATYMFSTDYHGNFYEFFG